MKKSLIDIFKCKTTKPFLSVIALSSIALNPKFVSAIEGGNSAYLKGSRDFLTGVVPKDPGVYFRDDVVFYEGSIKKTVLSGKVQARLDADLLVNLIRPTIVTPWEVFGGTYAFGFTWPQIDASINGQLTRSNGKIEGEENLTDFGDIIATPFLVGWYQGNWHINTSLSVWVPTGSYEHGRVLNTGKNYWSVSPQIGVTYLEPQTGWDFSATGIYLVNFENTATDYKSGDVLHFDLAVGKNITKALNIGTVGYVIRQVTPDTGDGATLGDLKTNVYGVGPAATITIPVGRRPVAIMGKYYREFGAKNTTEGDQAVISVSFKY